MSTTPHPDAALIAACAEHAANLAAYNRDGGKLNLDDDPLWAAYERTRDAISDAVQHTLDGMLAKAWAAKAEATHPDGTENPENCPAATWAWDLVNDLLRGTAQVSGHPDADLIAACEAFDELEHEYIVSAKMSDGDTPEAHTAETDLDRIAELQSPIVARMFELKAVTPEGMAARARSLVLWAPHLVAPGTGDTGAVLVHAVLRDLIGEAQSRLTI